MEETKGPGQIEISNLKPKQRLSTEDRARNVNTIALIGIQVCWTSLFLFVTTFLLSKLLIVSGHNIAMNGYFWAVAYTTLFVVYALLAPLVKRFSPVWGIRVGAAFAVLMVCLICTFSTPEYLKQLYLVFAVLYGVAAGIIWISFNSFVSMSLGGGKMLRYQSYVNIGIAAANIILPFTLGAIINTVNFYVASLVAAGIGVILIIFTFILQTGNLQRKKYSLKNFVHVIRTEKLTGPVAHNFALQLFRGLFLATGLFSVILITRVFGDNSFTLGYLTSIFAAASIVVLVGYRFIRSRKVKNTIFIASAILALGMAAGMLFVLNQLTVILFQVAAVVLIVVPNIETAKLQADGMKELNHPELSTEGLVVMELAYYIARMFTVGLMIGGYYLSQSVDPNLWFFRVGICVLVAMIIPAFVLFYFWWKRNGHRTPKTPYAPKANKRQVQSTTCIAPTNDVK